MVTPSSRSSASTSNSSLIIAGASPSDGSSKQQDARLRHQPTGDREHLLLATGEKPRAARRAARAAAESATSSAATSPSRSTSYRVYAPSRMLSRHAQLRKNLSSLGHERDAARGDLDARRDASTLRVVAARSRRSPDAEGRSRPAWPSIFRHRSRQAARPFRPGLTVERHLPRGRGAAP